MERRKFFVKFGDFANVYTVVWSFDNSPLKYGYERISYRRAVIFCKKERFRIEQDHSFSGYATICILPYSHYIDLDTLSCNLCFRYICNGFRFRESIYGFKLHNYIVDYED